MSPWQLPEVLRAAERIRAEAAILQLEARAMTPLERLQEARARCVPGTAIIATMKAEELEKFGPWKAIPVDHGNRGIGLNGYLKRRSQAAQEGYAQIRELAAAHPDWSRQEVASHVGCSTTTVSAAVPGRWNGQRQKIASAERRYREIHALAAANPGLSCEQLGELAGVSRTTAAKALQHA
jgi:hypothetical protein